MAAARELDGVRFQLATGGCGPARRCESGLDTAEIHAEGIELARVLKRHVGPETEVVFAPEAEDGGLLPEQVAEAELGALPDGGGR